jgi:hypothetical protein
MVLWWIGNAILLVVVVPVLLFLAGKIISRALEIRRYAADILEHGAGVDRNLEPVPALAVTRERVAEVKASAVRYLDALERAV